MPIEILRQFASRFGILSGCIGAIFFVVMLGPYIKFGDYAPLQSNAAKWTVAGVIFFGWVIYELAKRLLQRKRDEKLTKSLLGNSAASSPEEVRRKFEQALLMTRNTRFGGKRLSLQSMPWYMVIGPPGSGKTSLLRSSGLRWPARDLIGAEASRGVGGTRNCAWWISEEAVLLDTAGRYTTQAATDGSDKAEWEAFLENLKVQRPRQPLNGVIVVIGADAIAEGTERKFESLVGSVTDRIREAVGAFGIMLPVYLVISKMDRVPGFLELFEDSGEQLRRQALGLSLGTRSAEQPPSEMFAQRLQDWLRRAELEVERRLADEQNRGRVRDLLSFVGQINSFSQRLSRLCNGVANLGDLAADVDLRGVYWSSAVQDGVLLDQFAAAVGFEIAGRSDDEFEQPLARPYFIEGIFRNHVFRESGLAGSNLSTMLRSRRQFWIAAAAMGVVAALVISLLLLSFVNNRSLIARAQEQASFPQPAPDTSHFAVQTLRALDGVQGVVRAPAEQRPWSHGFLLAQAPGIDKAVSDGARKLIENGGIVFVAKRIEEAVLDPGLDRIIRFELLKAYLMLGGEAPVPMDRALIESAIGVVLVERTEAERAVAFEAGRLMAAAAERGISRAKINPAVLEQARLLLGNDRDRLAAEFVLDRLREDFNRSEAAAAVEFAVAQSPFFGCTARFAGDPFYTAAGIGFVERSLPNRSDLFSADLWVLGVSGGSPGGAGAVVTELARKTYTEQYLQRWRTDLATCEARPVSRADLQAFAAELSGGSLPMTALLRQLRPHLAPADLAAAGSTVSLRDVEGSSDGARRLLERAGAGGEQPAAAPARSIAARVREGFGELAAFLDGGGAVSIGSLEAMLGAVATDLQDERVAGAAGLGVREMQQAGIGSVNALRDVMRNATQYPEPIAGWIRQLFDSARAAQVESVAEGIAAAQQERLRKDCPRALLQMYPFRKTAKDEAPPLMVQEALGPQGYFESTLSRELDGEVSFGPTAWTFRGELKTVAGIPESALESFRLARFAANRLGFSTGSGGFPLGISARGLGAGLAQVTVQLGPETLRAVRAGDSGLMNWSPQTGNQMVFSFIGIDGVTSEVRLAGSWSLMRAVDRFLERPSEGGVLLKVDSGQHSASIELSSLQLRELVMQPGWRSLGCPV